MNLHILFGHRRERYPGEYSPEPLLCWSEYEVDGNAEGFEANVEKTLRERAKDFQTTRLILVRVDDDALARALQAPTLAGEIVQ